MSVKNVINWCIFDQMKNILLNVKLVKVKCNLYVKINIIPKMVYQQ